MRQGDKTFVTGQQIGLLGGPLFTTYKVLGAIHHAERAGGNAVYWLETNDADFNEINRIDFIDSGGSLRSLKWDIDSRGYSCGSIKVDDRLILILNEFFNSVHRTEHTDELKHIVFDSYAPGRSLGDASAVLAKSVFNEFELEIFDPSIREFRVFSRPILIREAEHTADGQQCNLFYMDGKKRVPLFRKGKGFTNREGAGVDIRSVDLVPSLKTRSICQDAYFNTSAYIAGPGEAAYLKEMKQNFLFHGVKPARVIPRMSIDLLEPRIKKAMEKSGITMPDIDTCSVDDLSGKVLKELTGYDKKELAARTASLAGSFIDSLEEMGLPTDKFGKKLRTDIREMIGAKRKRDKERTESVLSRINMVYTHLRPYGIRQERLFNMFYYMNLYGGTGLIKKIRDRYDERLDFMELKNG